MSLKILQDPQYSGFSRLDKKVAVTNPVTVIKEGMCVKLDANSEVVKTGGNGALETFVYFALTAANDSANYRSDFSMTGGVTLVSGVFEAETDQYDVNGSYGVLTKLSTENGILIPAASSDCVVGRVVKPPAGGILTFLAIHRPGVK